MKEEKAGNKPFFTALYAVATGKESYSKFVRGKITTGLMNFIIF